jgi:hypothetical protein
MPVNNIFASDFFSVQSLTAAINKLPFVPSRIGQMGLFSEEPITTTSAVIEEDNGLLAVLPFGRRGGPATPHKTGKRTARSLNVPHIPYEDVVLAEAVQNIRTFGSDNQMESVSSVVNSRMEKMRQNHEVTHEYHRANAVQGFVRDSDGGILYNIFEEFDVDEQTDVDFVFGTATTDIRGKCIGIKRTIEAALGGAATFNHIHCLCGSDFFDDLISHTTVKAAYDRYQEGAVLRSDPRAGFDFAGIIFENYVGTVSGNTFIPTTDARFFPVGVNGLFQTILAPADFMETVNTPGLAVYAKQEELEFNRGIKIHTQSNPLCICTRPGVLVRGYSST